VDIAVLHQVAGFQVDVFQGNGVADGTPITSSPKGNGVAEITVMESE
jgi:hypothetical protein